MCIKLPLTDEMIGAAAHSVVELQILPQTWAPVLPPFKYVADVSIKVAEAVAKKHKNKDWLELKKRYETVRDFKWI